MDSLPLFHKLQDRPCLVVGGGQVATRRVRLLRRAGAQVMVIAPDLTPELADLATQGAIEARRQLFVPEQAPRYALVIAATNDRNVNRQVSEWAQGHHLPVNVVDDPELCTVIMPAIVDRNPVLVAVSTSGTSPTLARLLRARLETLLPRHLASMARLLKTLRQRLKRVVPDIAQRTRIWSRVLDSQLLEPRALSETELERRLRASLLAQTHSDIGTVTLVGAGPGDPDWLTLGGLRALQGADVVVHDRLVSQQVLDLARKDAEFVAVGKQAGGPSVSQEHIHRVLINLAREGKQVCRLKGGDALVFARGGEEMQALRAADIPVRIIPGVTAASGCAAAAGIPLTHRDLAHGVALLTGHDAEQGRPVDFRGAPSGTADAGITRVYYMGLGRRAAIRRQLIRSGLGPDTPAAIIERGGQPGQRVVTGELGQLDQLGAPDQGGAPLHSPALIIVGKVASLASDSQPAVGDQVKLAPNRVSETSASDVRSMAGIA